MNRDSLDAPKTAFLHAVAVCMQHARRSVDYRILASVGIAQVLWESAWGKHAPGNNYLGIKAGGTWEGPTTTFTTHEIERGVSKEYHTAFRAYDNLEACCLDYAKVLATHVPYMTAMSVLQNRGKPDQTTTYLNVQMPVWEAYARELSHVYATDPAYAEGIVNLVKGLELRGYDEPIGS